MINLLLIIIGFIFLIKGADLLVEGSSNIARKFKVSEFVIGLTIVSIGTSLPELIVSIQSVLRGYDNLLVGNIIGSCIYNFLLILGIVSIIKPIKIKIKEEANIILMLFSLFAVAILGNIYGTILQTEGLMLIALFSIFLLTTTLEKENKKQENSTPILKSIFVFIVGIILLNYGGNFVVDNASEIARNLNISEKIIGMTIVAIGTSLPEVVTAILAIRKDTVEIAVGSIIGSNIFNLLLVLGLTSVIKPIRFSSEYNSDLLFLIIPTIILTLTGLREGNEKTRKFEGIILVIFFILYNIKLITT